MTRLLFISTGLRVGGAEISLLNILQHLDRDRFEPHVVSLTGPGEIGIRIRAIGVPVIELDFGKRQLMSFVTLVRTIRSLRPNVVQTWMYHADLLGGLAARLAGVRHVSWGIHNSNLAPGASRSSTIAVAKVCAWLSHRLPQAIVSCSAVAADIHRALGYRADRFVLIGNGVDLDHFHPEPAQRIAVRAELGLPADTPLVIHVGRHHPQKNHPGLLRAVALVHRTCPAAHFVLVGNGVTAENKALSIDIAAAGVGPTVHCLGLREDTARLMSASDLLVLSSSSGEAYPLVLGEAMACGVPCVSTDVGDSGAIVGDCGRVVPPHDDEALAAAIVEVLCLPATQRDELGRRARGRALSNFDIREVTRRYQDLYSNLLKDIPCAA
jgi:glycosyltransferase involved in cell wall biosynthesis